MNKILKNIYWKNCSHETLYQEERERINKNQKEIKQTLNDRERVLLLRIVDDYELMAGITGEDSFYQGMQVGVKLLLEILYRK